MSTNLPALRNAGVAVPRVAAKAVNEIAGAAAVATARVEATAYVTYAGMHAVANLSETEAMLIQRSPLAEPRLRLLADTGSAAIANVIDRLGY